MSYQIQYFRQVPERQKPRFFHFIGWTLLFFLTFCAIVARYFPEQAPILRSWFLPGQTAAVLQRFSSAVDAGMSPEDAVSAFCRELFSHVGH